MQLEAHVPNKGLAPCLLMLVAIDLPVKEQWVRMKVASFSIEETLERFSHACLRLKCVLSSDEKSGVHQNWQLADISEWNRQLASFICPCYLSACTWQRLTVLVVVLMRTLALCADNSALCWRFQVSSLMIGFLLLLLLLLVFLFVLDKFES